jgi:hypothetical protein
MPAFLRILRVASAASLLISVLCFILWSWRWPLVGDASQIHYIVFLIGHGQAPYRDLGDMNMPGTYLIEMAAMKAFGAGALGWRLFDFALLGCAAAALRVVTRRAGWMAAIFAAALFALAHGRDGLEQAGQRDLSMAVLLIGATAALFLAIRQRSSAAIFVFGLLAGIATTIKPTALPLSVAQLAIVLFVLRNAASRVAQAQEAGPVKLQYPAAMALAGMAIGPLIAFGFLLSQRSVGAFLAAMHGIVPYYASLGHKPLGYLLEHSTSPFIALIFVWIAVLLLARPPLNWERGLLLAGAVFGLSSYILQARGFPYHRYPEMVFLLPLMAIDFVEALAMLRRANGTRTKRMRVAGGLAAAAIAFAGLFLAPQSALQIHRFRWWETDFNSTLETNLDRLGGAALSGQIQCIDWVTGCETTLYGMKLVSATGLLEDFLIFGKADVPVVAKTRKTFGDEVFEHPPRVIVVSSWLHIDGPDDYKKLDLWPAFKTFLVREYVLDTEWKPVRSRRWWGREEMGHGYRIYVLKNLSPG